MTDSSPTKAARATESAVKKEQSSGKDIKKTTDAVKKTPKAKTPTTPKAKPLKPKSSKSEKPKESAKAAKIDLDTFEFGWQVARHPSLSTEPPFYYVHVDGHIASRPSTSGILSTISSASVPTYSLRAADGSHRHVRLVEVMIWTFLENFNSDTDHIFYKDGWIANCALSNLIVCDAAQLQLLQAKLLTETNPSVKFVRAKYSGVVYVDDLVGDNGDVYHIPRRVHLDASLRKDGSKTIRLACSKGKTKHVVDLAKLVLESFDRPCEPGEKIMHMNGNIGDCSLNNLQSLSKRKYTILQKKLHPKPEVNVKPLPPITSETKWSVIGAVPWSIFTFSKYEVSNVGHVREKASKKEIERVHQGNNLFAAMIPDQLKLTKEPRICHEIIARLVAHAFVEPQYTKERSCVKRINGDSQDLHFTNLKWVSREDALVRCPGHKVIAKLVDEPKSQKVFPTKTKAMKELSLKTISASKGDAAVKREAMWDGEKREVLLQVM